MHFSPCNSSFSNIICTSCLQKETKQTCTSNILTTKAETIFHADFTAMDVVKIWNTLLTNCTSGTNIYSVPTAYLKMQGIAADMQIFEGMNETNSSLDCDESNGFSNNEEDDNMEMNGDEQAVDENVEENETEKVDACETERDDVGDEQEKCENSNAIAKKQAKILRNRYSREEYRCTMCPYTCTTEKAFLRHLHRCESAEKRQEIQLPLSCPVCGKDRKGEHSLSIHMKKHKDNKHFCCDICKFRTLQLKKLIQHRRMHTGERPHLCPFCSYRSARRDNLRSHARRVHKQDNLPCDTFTPRSMLVTPRKMK